MIKDLILCYLLLFVMDLNMLVELRDLVYSFLLSKHNLKGARKIHVAQTRKQRFTLSYIKEHTIYPQKFRFFYRLRLLYIYSIIPQYCMVIIISFLSQKAAVITIIVLVAIKFIVELFIVRPNFRGRISIYSKLYDEKYKNK